MYDIQKRSPASAGKFVKARSDKTFAGIAAGNGAGTVWADDPDNPSSAVVWSEGLQCFQFMGDAHNRPFNAGLRAFIEGDIASFLRNKDLDYFEYAADDEAWYPVLLEALAGRDIKENRQFVYKPGKEKRQNSDGILPDGYALRRIDKRFLNPPAGPKVSNPGFLVDFISDNWGSTDEYLEKGYGYLAEKNGEIAGFCLTTALYGKTHTISVETLDHHRRRGLAGALSRALFSELYEKGCDIWWDCMESNVASQKTAEGAGLVLDHTYRLCWFYFK